jgi:enolase
MPKLIDSVTARQILDSRGTPTVEAICRLTDGSQTIAGVPSGASTGIHEALELRDLDPADYLGKSVHQAVDQVNRLISPRLIGQYPENQEEIDHRLTIYPGPDPLGANATLATSIACAKAGALTKQIPLYRHIADLSHFDQPLRIPVPMSNVLNGGLHAGMNLDFQEFMLVPNPRHLTDFPGQLRAIAVIYHFLHQILSSMNQPVTVGDEGGFAPRLRTNRGALKLLEQAVTLSDLTLGQDLNLALDCAANTFCQNGLYHLKDFEHPLSYSQYIGYLQDLIASFHVVSIEDPLPEDSWDEWVDFTHQETSPALIVGDDLTVTNFDRLQVAVEKQAITGVIVKPNQIGTVSQAIETATFAAAHHIQTVVSHRSGETTDDFVADFAVGIGADYVKFGAPARGERVVKYNRLLAIHSELQ